MTPPEKSGADRRLKITVTYLEMRQPPLRRPTPLPPRQLALLRAKAMPVHFYRYLYGQVGEPWLWYERRAMSDLQLAEIIQDDRVEIHVLYADGVPAGYSELDRRGGSEIELSYLGIMPELIGQGLGRYLLECTIDLAWRHAPARLWLHTCDLDHPRALQGYQRAGFVPYRQETKEIEDPRATGLIPADLGPAP